MMDKPTPMDGPERLAELIRLLMGHAPAAIAMFDRDMRYLMATPRWREDFRLGDQPLIGRSHYEVFPDVPDHWKAMHQRCLQGASERNEEEPFVRSDGRIDWVRGEIQPWRDGNGEIGGIVMFSEVITQTRRAEETIKRMAYSDPLTDLPNKQLFMDRLHQVIANAGANERQAAVMFLDLDRFKLINDTLGHDIGDLLLMAIAERLAGCMGPADTVARLGGDEFTILLGDVLDAGKVAMVAESILAALSKPIRVRDQELFVSASIGISMFPDDGEQPVDLLKNADAALYQAKEHGNGYEFYSADMNAKAPERLALENSLRKALDRGEITLHYQPQLDLASSRIVGAEALARWQHPELGMIPPATFIPLAEETGLILPITEWVLRTACLQNMEWQAAGLPAIRISVNLSGRSFKQRDLAAMVSRVFGETGLLPQHLDLELTESSLMEDVEATTVTLDRLNAMGIQLSIDDFGTGYSSLSYLKRFPLSTLKIDRSFIRDLANDQDDAAIVKAIIALAHSLCLRVVAEGVETEEQLAFLRAENCDEIQGYYFSRPLPADAFMQFLAKQTAIHPPLVG
jgi:diguanylate cyclase (GGDEF)-like protein/PAS domain S-box-containing protein